MRWEMSVGFSMRRFTEEHRCCTAAADGAAASTSAGRGPKIILGFLVRDADAEYERIKALGVTWVMLLASQPWGNRSMIFRDPEGSLIDVFSRPARQERGRRATRSS